MSLTPLDTYPFSPLHPVWSLSPLNPQVVASVSTTKIALNNQSFSTPHTRTIRAIHARNGKLVTAGFDGKVCVWNVEEKLEGMEEAESDEEDEEEVEEFGRAVGKDNGIGEKTIASKQDTDELHTNNQRKRKLRLTATLEGHESEVKHVAFSDDARRIATAGRDKTIWIWGIEEEEEDDEEWECLQVLQTHTQDVKYVTFHPTDDAMILSAAYDDTCIIHTEDNDGSGDWNAAGTAKGHSATVWAAEFNTDGTLFASCSADQSVKIWSHEKGRNIQMIQDIQNAHDGEVYSLSWSHVHDAIVTGGGDDAIRVWTKMDGSYQQTACVFNAHKYDINCVVWSANGEEIYSSGDDGVVRTWRWTSAAALSGDDDGVGDTRS